MKKVKYFLALWIALGVVFTSLLSAGDDPEPLTETEKNAISSLSISDVKKHVLFLSSDELKGRGTGTEEQDIAARYIASHFKAWGLKPHKTAENLDGYYQKFEFGSGDLQGSLKNVGENKTEEIAGSDEMNIFNRSATGDFGEAGVVFAGYGISDKERGYNDYENVDVEGKYVVIFRHEPRENDPDSPFNGTDWTKNAYFRTKYQVAQEQGAKGVILFNDPLGNHDGLPGNRGRSRGSSGDIPYLSVTPKTAAEILNRSVEDLSSLQKKIDSNLEPASFEVENTKISVTVKQEDEGKTVRNVVGILEGSDPELKDEYIVVGAHYDGQSSKTGRPSGGSSGRRRSARDMSAEQLKQILEKYGDRLPERKKKALKRLIRKKEKNSDKKNEQSKDNEKNGDEKPGEFPGETNDENEEDNIYNAADDNASGTTGVMMLARMMANLPEEKRPRRSIVFVLFTAEELGLIGSRHYVNNPVVPLDQTAAMINLDMIGRAKGNKVDVRGSHTSNYMTRLMKEITPHFDLEPTYKEGGVGASDHANFVQKNVPSVFFFTGLHDHYHSPADEWDLLNYDTMAEIIRAEFVFLYRLSRTSDVPDFKGNERKLADGDTGGPETEESQKSDDAGDSSQEKQQKNEDNGDRDEDPEEKDSETEEERDSW